MNIFTRWSLAIRLHATLFRGWREMIVQESGEHEGGDDGEVLGERAVFAPLEVDAQQVTGHGNDVKADGFERVAHFVGVAAGLAFRSCAALGAK